jgi:hypothetical protein
MGNGWSPYYPLPIPITQKRRSAFLPRRSPAGASRRFSVIADLAESQL